MLPGHSKLVKRMRTGGFMSLIRILVVDNNSGQSEALTASLKKHLDFEIVGVTSTRESALRMLSLLPDIVILNPEVLKQRTLSRFIHSVQSISPHTRAILIFETHPPDETIITDVKTGVRGYISVTDAPAIVAKAIRAVHEGEIWAERRLLEMALSKPMLLPETLLSHIPGLQPLTDREMEVLTMVLQGATNREIADRSSISERTVKTHLYRVYKKLKVKSRTKAIALLSH
jgi:DNA-binding NarL/FixJ family response regulator